MVRTLGRGGAVVHEVPGASVDALGDGASGGAYGPGLGEMPHLIGRGVVVVSDGVATWTPTYRLGAPAADVAAIAPPATNLAFPDPFHLRLAEPSTARSSRTWRRCVAMEVASWSRATRPSMATLPAAIFWPTAQR